MSARVAVDAGGETVRSSRTVAEMARSADVTALVERVSRLGAVSEVVADVVADEEASGT